MFKLHAELGLNFSADKKEFNASVSAALAQLANDVVAANNNNVIDKFISDKESTCSKLLSDTRNFVEDVLVPREQP